MKGLLKKQVVLAILLATISGSAFALVFNFPKKTAGSIVSSTSEGSIDDTTSYASQQQTVNIAQENKCIDSRNYLSWDLLKTVADFENHPPRVEKRIVGDRVDLQVYIPTYIKECFDPKIEILTIEKPKRPGFIIQVRNNFFQKNPVIVKEIFGSEEEMNRLTQDARLTKCFENRFKKAGKIKTIVKDGVKQDVVDIEPDRDMEIGRVVHLTNPAKVDDVENVFVYMNSPVPGLVPRSGVVKNVDNKNICYKVENFNMEDKETPILDSKILKDKSDLEGCSGSEDCIQRHIDQLFETLKTEDYEGLSNTYLKYLEDILFKKDKIGNDNKEYKNIQAQMKDIVKKMGELAEDMLEGGDDDIKKLSRDYDELRYKLESDYMNPLIEILEKRYEMRKKADSEEERKTIDDSIVLLNRLIGMYAEETGRADEVVVLLAAKGLSMNAKKAGDLYFRSVNWSMVNHDEDGFKPNEAKKEIMKAGKQLVKETKEAKIKYLVSTGKKTMSPVYISQMRATEQGYQAQMEQMYSREMELRKGCTQSPWGFGVLNQANCSKYYKGMNVRNQQRMITEESYKRNMTQLQAKASGWRKYEMLGARYKRAQREERYGSLYGGNNFSSRIDFGSADSYLFNNSYNDVSYDSMDYMMYPDYGLEFDMPQSPFGNNSYMNSSPNQMLMQRQQGYSPNMYGGGNNGMNFGGSLNYGQGQMPYGQWQ